MPAWIVLGPANESNVDGKDGPSASMMTQETLARRGGFFRDALSMSERALRSIKRDPESRYQPCSFLSSCTSSLLGP